VTGSENRLFDLLIGTLAPPAGPSLMAMVITQRNNQETRHWSFIKVLAVSTSMRANLLWDPVLGVNSKYIRT
jgi:hypothetical protein